MSRLLVVTQPELASGFHLAGVDAFAAANAEEACQLIAKWLDSGESGLLAVDEKLLAGFDAAFRRRLDGAEQLPYLTLPSGSAAEGDLSEQRRIAALLRQAVGVHISFHGMQG